MPLWPHRDASPGRAYGGAGATVPTLTADVQPLLTAVAGLDRAALIALAERARYLPAPPAFSGRCLDPVYLAAVASGDWSRDDEARLADCRQRSEAVVRQVGVRHRRRLRLALSATALSVLTRHLPQPGWQERRARLSSPWQDVVGPLPRARGPVD